jgi:uncharacterized membrane protein YcaP (DUF421 family)
MGKRQMGELEISELVSTLVISEVAALPVADPDIPLLNAIIPVILIVCLEIIISYAKNKSAKLKKCVEGQPIFVIYRGKLRQSALNDNRISLNELLCELRMQGVGDIKNVYYAILEPNGKLSVFEKSQSNSFSHNVIIDTEANTEELTNLGLNEIWLENELKKLSVSKKDVFLMTVDDSKNTYVIKKDLENESS